MLCQRRGAKGLAFLSVVIAAACTGGVCAYASEGVDQALIDTGADAALVAAVDQQGQDQPGVVVDAIGLAGDGAGSSDVAPVPSDGTTLDGAPDACPTDGGSAQSDGAGSTDDPSGDGTGTVDVPLDPAPADPSGTSAQDGFSSNPDNPLDPDTPQVADGVDTTGTEGGNGEPAVVEAGDGTGDGAGDGSAAEGSDSDTPTDPTTNSDSAVLEVEGQPATPEAPEATDDSVAQDGEGQGEAVDGAATPDGTQGAGSTTDEAGASLVEDPEGSPALEPSDATADENGDAPDATGSTAAAAKEATASAETPAATGTDKDAKDGTDASAAEVGASETVETAVESDGVKQGWYLEDGKTYWYENGVRATGQKKIDGYWYYLDPAAGGARVEASFATLPNADKTCYYDALGRMQYGQRKVDGSWYYLRPGTGARAEAQFVSLSGGSKTCYYDGEGRMQYGQRKIDGSWYYLRPGTGARTESQFVTFTTQQKTVYYGDDGAMRYGQQKVDGKWYYLRPATGARVESSFFDIARPEKTVYYGDDGAMRYGQVRVDGKWYYMTPGTGAMVRDQLVTLRGSYIAFGEKVSSKNCYYCIDGTMAYGQLEVDGKWYYLEPGTGARAESRFVTHSDQNKTVYYDEWGVMVFGRRQIDGTTYCFAQGSGALYKAGYQNPAGMFEVSSFNVTLPHSANWPFNYATPSGIGVWASRDECVERFISTAYSYLGTSYIWDYACAPGVGVDCAGLVVQCLYSCGVDLGYTYNPYDHYYTPGHDHYANDMSADSRFAWVSLENRARGDLIFTPGHVSIYLGDDAIIEAYPGYVTTNSMWAHGTPTVVRRPFV